VPSSNPNAFSNTSNAQVAGKTNCILKLTLATAAASTSPSTTVPPPGQVQCLSRLVWASKTRTNRCITATGELFYLNSSVAVQVSDFVKYTSIKPPGPLGDLSVIGYTITSDSINLHFCNTRTESAGIRPGSYSFLAVH
jgi:hypothetical protein